MKKKIKNIREYINNKSNFLLPRRINNLQTQIKTLIDISKQIISPEFQKRWKRKHKHKHQMLLVFAKNTS